LGAVVAEVSLRPYDSTANTALIASLVLGLAVLVVVAIASRLLISAALRPVARMTTQAAEWSDTDAELRFDMGPPKDELTQLAATLDGLLDRVATSLRHEQRFSAELSHELRTPLASVIAETQLGLRHAGSIGQYRSGYEKVLASAQQMTRTLDTLVAAARAEVQARGTGDAAAAAHAAAQGSASLAAERDVAITVVDPDAPVHLGVEADVAERVLSPLVENGARHGESSVTITIERGERSVRFFVEDDGRGVSEDARDRIFEPGWRGESANGDGAGLGLPLARRLARAVGGDVTLEASAAGARFSARLPVA
jgi:signal transduction histidine kinase